MSKTITFGQIDKTYPRIFQTLGYDVELDMDDFNRPKVIPTLMLVVKTVQMLLFMKPGQYPSIPELGIDISQYMHEYADNKGTPKEILAKLNEQCNLLSITGITIDCYFDKTTDGIDALVIEIKADDRSRYGTEVTSVIIGVTYDELNQLYSKEFYINNNMTNGGEDNE